MRQKKNDPKISKELACLLLVFMLIASLFSGCEGDSSDNNSSSRDKEYVPVEINGKTIYFEKIR